MELIAIAILLIGFMFFMVHLASKIEVRTDSGDVVPLNAMIVMILIAFSAFTAFFSVQLMLGMAIEANLSPAVTSTLESIHMFINAGTILILFLIFFGVLINTGWALTEWVSKKFFSGGRNGR